MIDGWDHRTMTATILRRFRQADADTVTAGVEWYDRAFTDCEAIGAWAGWSATRSAVALAHLSPRCDWSANLVLLGTLLNGEQRPNWALGRQWAIALQSLTAPDPLASFSSRARKTRAFALAILGDRNAVAVDTWTARAAGVPADYVRSQAGYAAVVDAFHRGARRVNLAPRELQAVVWCHARQRAA